MAYEPTVWRDGDTITTARLNKLEQGVAEGGGTLIANIDFADPTDITSITVDKNATDVMAAMQAGMVIFCRLYESGDLLGCCPAIVFFDPMTDVMTLNVAAAGVTLTAQLPDGEFVLVSDADDYL